MQGGKARAEQGRGDDAASRGGHYLCSMFVLAVSGPLLMSVVIVASVLLLFVLLRLEARDESAAPSEEPEERPR